MNYNFRYQGEYESKKKQNIQEAIEYILDKDYGSTLLHQDLARILQYNIDDEDEFQKYKSVMSRVKNFLLKYGYVLKGISGVGFYILKPEQISGHCYRTYVKKAARLYDKSDYILHNVDKGKLNTVRIQELQDMIDLNKELIENAWNTVKESPYYSRMDYYNSLEIDKGGMK